MAFPVPNPMDLIDLVLKIKSTIDTVLDNDGKLRALADELHDSVRSLVHCTSTYHKLPKSQTNTFLSQFNHALRALQHDLLQSLEHCQSLARVGTTGQFTTLRSRVYSWWNRDQIAGEIQQIQRKVEHHFRKFSMWGLTAATGAVGSLQADVRSCHDLLKSINGRLSETIRRAALDPLKAAHLISATAMGSAKLRSNLARAMQELQRYSANTPFRNNTRILHSIWRTPP
ncbi:hypothetical protein DENSPDRAFT_217723 [Dentipellis sp. KUC8613]|nr:hypothetical protein DENSPDRAFT_217723 [Dentipellis sp. KUC8613]